MAYAAADLFAKTAKERVFDKGFFIVAVSGKNKADIVKTILECSEARLPAQRIQCLNGTLTWLLDSESASRLSKKYSHEKHE